MPVHKNPLPMSFLLFRRIRFNEPSAKWKREEQRLASHGRDHREQTRLEKEADRILAAEAWKKAAKKTRRKGGGKSKRQGKR